MKNDLLNDLKKISRFLFDSVDEENQYYQQRAHRQSEMSPSPVKKYSQNPSVTNSDQIQETRISKCCSSEDDIRVLREKLFEESKDLIVQESDKMKEEMSSFFGEVVKQVKVLAQTRIVDRDIAENLGKENEEIVSYLRALNDRMEKMENRMFGFDMTVINLRDKGSLRIIQFWRRQMRRKAWFLRATVSIRGNLISWSTTSST
jgi:hypothetical protein